MRGAALFLVLGLVVGCTTGGAIQPTASDASVPEPVQGTQTGLPEASCPTDAARWDVYDADRQHLWNRLFRRLYERTSADGRIHGWDSLDPLLWYETTHLLEETSHRPVIQLLDEFLSTGAEGLVHDPVKRALLQRDLWAVFDWTNLRSDTFPEERGELRRRLAQAIRRLGLPRDVILSLPDNLSSAVDSKVYPAEFQTDDPHRPFLPAGLLDLKSAWLLLGREGGPLAMSHTEAFPFFGRSVFLVFLRAPGGQGATLTLLERLNSERGSRSLAALDLTGVEVALVRRAVLIDDSGEMVLSPLVESIQVRYYAPRQEFHEFDLSRTGLFDGAPGGLCPIRREFGLFFSQGLDPFESGVREPAVIAEACRNCHGGMVYGVQSILSYSRFRFELPGGEAPYLSPTTVEAEARSVISWKSEHWTWTTLMSLPSR